MTAAQFVIWIRDRVLEHPQVAEYKLDFLEDPTVHHGQRLISFAVDLGYEAQIRGQIREEMRHEAEVMDDGEEDN